jgi:hypothetical protein
MRPTLTEAHWKKAGSLVQGWGAVHKDGERFIMGQSELQTGLSLWGKVTIIGRLRVADRRLDVQLTSRRDTLTIASPRERDNKRLIRSRMNASINVKSTEPIGTLNGADPQHSCSGFD